MTQDLDLIFTRDLPFFGSQFWRALLVEEIPRVWGRGFSEQVAFFNGRTTEYYRLRDEVQALKAYVSQLSLEHALFSSVFSDAFRDAAQRLRQHLSCRPATSAERAEAFHLTFDLWKEMYPGYMLTVFLPGLWADDLRAAHGTLAEPLIARWLQNRRDTEGLHDEAGFYARELAERELEERGSRKAYGNVVTREEMERLFADGALPNAETCEERLRGCVLIGGRAVSGRSFEEALSEGGYQYDPPVIGDAKVCRGKAAFVGPVVRGPAHVAMNARDLEAFPEGAVLVAPMTMPDYLPAMKRAAAIVTDEGGLTCHAAIVARELGKPTLVGTKCATKVFKTGDVVEVDTERGIVGFLH